MRRLLIASLILTLAGCLGGGTDKPATGANPITGDAVSTTTLAPPPGAGPAAVTPAAAAQTPAKPPADPATNPPATGTPPAADPAAQGSLTVEAPPASPEARACLKKGGQWSKVGKGGYTCLKPTRDAGKSCSRATQCEGLCLARSGTCAPLTPLFGCNEVFQNDGTRATLCID